ncbi:serine/threonine-protein kinase ULK4-like [Pongo abelii]|uniref:serine/threonine-protein kinase ULK4-like n=1 Tax=Pongo abelii TaxID=9601 RepID=UPI0023E845E5|nr:serine/threonine-protein kinase ULK4-like [Pongo abelii]
MSLSAFKAKLKLPASIFHENQEPQPPLTLHRNIKITSGHLSQQDLESQMRVMKKPPSVKFDPKILHLPAFSDGPTLLG